MHKLDNNSINKTVYRLHSRWLSVAMGVCFFIGSVCLSGELSAQERKGKGKRGDRQTERGDQNENAGQEKGKRTRGKGQRDGGQRENGQRDGGQRGQGQRDCGQRGKAQRGQGQRGQGQRGQRELTTESLLKTMDKDQNGSIELSEAGDRLKRNWDLVDKDGNEVIDSKELDQLVARLQELRQQGAQRGGAQRGGAQRGDNQGKNNKGARNRRGGGEDEANTDAEGAEQSDARMRRRRNKKNAPESPSTPVQPKRPEKKSDDNDG